MSKRSNEIAGFICAALAGVAAVWTGVANAQNQGQGGGPPEVIIHPVNPHKAGAPTAGSTGQVTPRISYHGGPVMATPHVYLIWYGNWNTTNGSDTAAGVQLVKDFLYGLSNSPYYQINTSYGTPTGLLTTAGSTTDSYSLGSNLTDANIQTVVRNAIASGKLGAADASGIYLVLTSSDVNATSGFCTKYCGWHTHSTGVVSGSDIKYAFIGNANRCLNSCAAQTTSPNGNAGVDGMISVIAHELEEANTDPNLNAWYDSRGAENADKCAWTFGGQQTLLPNGAYSNMSLVNSTGISLNFLVQRNLDASNKCYVNYVTKTQ